MSNKIISKRCSECKETKPISEFYKAQTSDGYRKDCKKCHLKQSARYAKTGKGKIAHRKAWQKYNESKKGKSYKKDFYEKNKIQTLLRAKINYQKPEVKAAKKAYYQSEKGKQVTKRYLQSEKGKVKTRKAAKNWQLKYPEQIKAQQAVKRAIKKGKLPHPGTLQCHYCPNQAKDYHHWHGYEPEHWLDVIPVCKKCHNKTYGKSA